MDPICGIWHGVATQAIPGQSPIRRQNPGKMADFVFHANGTCTTERKTLFGVHKEEWQWEYDTSEDIYILYFYNHGVRENYAVIVLDGNDLILRFSEHIPINGGTLMFMVRD